MTDDEKDKEFQEQVNGYTRNISDAIHDALTKHGTAQNPYDYNKWRMVSLAEAGALAANLGLILGKTTSFMRPLSMLEGLVIQIDENLNQAWISHIESETHRECEVYNGACTYLLRIKEVRVRLTLCLQEMHTAEVVA